MKKIFKSSLAWLLVLCMCLSNVSVVLVARAVEADGNKPETIWRGDEVTAEITAGKDGYTFVSVYRSPAHSYEFSNHALVSGSDVDIPQLFVLADASKDYTWSPDGRYSFGASNYEVLYCCDAETGLDDGIYYKRLNLEDSAYYDSDSAAHIRAILTNSYPYVSLEQMKANLIKAGVEGAENLDRAEILSAVQGAVWNFANGAAYEYKMSYNVTATPTYGIPMHDYTAELNPEVKSVIETLGNAYGSNANRKELADVGARVNAVIDYLMNLETVYSEKNQVIITDLEIVGANANTMNGEYLATVRVNLNNGGSSENDNIKLDIYVDGVLATSRPVYREITSYDINISAKAGQTIKAVVSGTQIMPQDVYFYEPEGGRDVSHCLVGIASGETDVYAESQVVLNAKTLVPVDKFATPLNKSFQTTVTLQVPGDVTGAVDVIFILGGGMTANRKTIDAAINVFESSMKSGAATVRIGIISLEKGQEIIVDLNSEEAVLDPDTYKDFITEKFEYMNTLPAGTTNLHSQLLEAQKMLAKETEATADNKYIFVLATGRTYWFDNENGDQSVVALETPKVKNAAGKTQHFYSWNDYIYRAIRSGHSSLYMVNAKYKDSWDAYWADVCKWVEADGDKYVYTPGFDKSDIYAYSAWAAKNNKEWRELYNGGSGGRYGNIIVNPEPTADNFVSTGVVDGVTYATNPSNALNYERAMYEAAKVYQELVDAGYNCYSICSETAYYQNNSPYIANRGYTGASTTQLGHSFMNYLARLGGQTEAPAVWSFKYDENGNNTWEEVLNENFFDSIKAKLTYTTAAGSYVEDYIGYDPIIGNFEFINDENRISLTVGDVQYVTKMTSSEKDGNGNIVKASYSFTKPGNDEATFWLDYDYGNGTTTEMFRWTFGEDASLVNRLSLVYDLQLIDMVTETGSYWIDTNLSATLYPVISTVVEDEVVKYVYGDPIIFPVPEVQYLVEKLDFEVTKLWDDDNDRDGIRPESVVIKLYVNDVEVKNATLTKDNETATNTWKHIFADVIVYKLPGEEVNYKIEEVVDEDSGYTATVDGLTITNVHVPEKVEVSGSKTWDDDNDRDGIRPESITINLLANGEKVQTITVTAENEWAWSFNNLNKYENGVEIVYTITEEAVEGYETVVDGYNVTNVHVPGKVSVSGSKTWDDDNNRDGIRPESITINLLANGKVVATKTVTEKDGWAWSFEGLNKYEDGVEIVYTITEEAVEGYETVVDGYNVTNVHVPEKVEISGSKTWDDDNNRDGIRPESITINLRANGKVVATKTVTAKDGWAWTFENLYKYENGAAVVYTITEAPVAGYETVVDGYNVTNIHVPGKVSVSGSKTWDDDNNRDGIRPESITINLLANGKVVETKTVTAKDGWAWSFKNLNKYEKGVEIVYTITEATVEGYETVVDGYNVTNIHVPGKISVSGSKTWDDDNNRDGIRPESITINLRANGKVVATKTVTAKDGWAWTFENLYKYENGAAVVYTITEAPVAGYETVVDGYNVTNIHVPGKVSVSGSKTWDDDNNRDGIRPESITINLRANGKVVATKTVTAKDGWAWSFKNLNKYEKGVEIVYTITEEAVEGYETVVDGYNVTNVHVPEKVEVSGGKTWDDDNNRDGIRPESITINLLANGKVVATKTVTAKDGWAWSFKNLNKYEKGVEIVYTITEEAVEGYEAVVDGYNVTNVHVPEKVEVSGSKTWDDDNNRDGIRPESITINLLANGKVVATKTVTEKDGWAWTFENLYKYENGAAVVYTITEAPVAGYETVVDGYNVTNVHVPEKVEISGGKTWNDDNNRDGIRPESITINLLANGKVVETKTVTEKDGWTWTFENLYKYENGVEIVYTITEEAVEGYETVVDGYNVTNVHVPEKVEVSGSKTWDDDNDRDGIRPESITINLLANGKVVATKTVTAKDGWAWSFNNLNKYENGVEIVYTITEEAVEGYETVVDGYKVTNVHVPEKVEVSGSKTWDDDNNRDGIRPESITINLLANGKVVATKTVTEKDGWTWTFENLYKYENGVEIVYTITEEAVEGYETVVDGYNVTNVHAPERVEVSGSKTWDDDNDRDGIRPESITINLLANGEKVQTITVTADDEWAWSFEGLNKYEDGVEIVYTITEEAVEGYETVIDGYNVTNVHVPEKVEVSGSKTWDDDNNRDGIRPESITINLLANGEKVQTITVTADDEWAWSFEGLNKYEDGVEIVYTITEEAVEGYETVIDGYNVTNVHVPEKVNVSGGKTWNDDNDRDGIRPESITINLLANGEKIQTITVSVEDDWAWSFENLNKYEDGVEIVYTITEESVDGYETNVDDFNITNVHVTEKISISVEKIWDDDDNFENARPESIIIRLYANGEEIAAQVISALEDWKWTFGDLNKFADGEEIVYTISEDEVEGYVSEISGNANDGFEVVNTYVVEFEEEDPPLTPPQLGDNGITTLLVVAVVSALISVALIARRKKID